MELISKAAAIDALTNTNLKRNVDSVQDGDMNRTRRAAQRVIANLPTVDAIPVEWLKTKCDKLEQMARGGHQAAWSIKLLLIEWQKEQEAKHEQPDTPEDQS